MVSVSQPGENEEVSYTRVRKRGRAGRERERDCILPYRRLSPKKVSRALQAGRKGDKQWTTHLRYANKYT